MLGAQARAAELAAASAAKQRQVSRELEERQLPPNPAVSLSAFTKSQPTTTRNKGTKHWKPLTLEDIAETTDDTPTSQPAIASPTDLDRLAHKQASDKKIPTAPRAMVEGRSLSTVAGLSHPLKPPPSPIVNLPVRNSPQRMDSAHHGGLPYLPVNPYLYLQQPVFVAGMPFREAIHGRSYGSMMVPDDISPTKQEQKLSMLGNILVPPTMQGLEGTQFTMAHHGMMQQDDPFSQVPPQPFAHAQQYLWDRAGNDGYFPGYHMPFPDQSQQIQGGYENERAAGYTSAYTAHKPSPPIGLDSTVNQNTIFPVFRDANQPPCGSPLRPREPYDTERAMKECVSKLKEEAKDGKTVLRNPNVHKEQIGRTDTESNRLAVMKPDLRQSSHPPVPWEVQAKGKPDANMWEFMPPPAKVNLNAASPLGDEPQAGQESGIVESAPGPPPSSISGLHELSLQDLTDRVENSDTPQVGSAAWMRLVPVTPVERARVRRCMARAARSVTNDVPERDILPSSNHEDTLQTQKWFYTDARGERLMREQVILNAQAHATRVIAHVKAHNGGELPEQFAYGKDDGFAATLILGNVACNLQTYLVGDRTSLDQRRNFHKVKSVPDWCTERGGLSVGGLGGGDSYFDGAAGGFYGAPVRVARDPRFRPQVKEGMKIKPEEEWKNRHEMYGRRIM